MNVELCISLRGGVSYNSTSSWALLAPRLSRVPVEFVKPQKFHVDHASSQWLHAYLIPKCRQKWLISYLSVLVKRSKSWVLTLWESTRFSGSLPLLEHAQNRWPWLPSVARIAVELHVYTMSSSVLVRISWNWVSTSASVRDGRAIHLELGKFSCLKYWTNLVEVFRENYLKTVESKWI